MTSSVSNQNNASDSNGVGIVGSVCSNGLPHDGQPKPNRSILDRFIRRLAKNQLKPNRLNWWHSDEFADSYISKLINFHGHDAPEAGQGAIALSVRELRRQLSKMTGLNDRQKQVSLSRRIFFHKSTRRAAVYIAAYESERIDVHCRLSVRQANGYAHELRKLRTCREPVVYRPKPKSNGCTRTTFMFGVVRYAQQVLLSLICSAQQDPYEFDFAMPGRCGSVGSSLAITKHIQQNGCRFWVVADIKNAYPAISTRMIKRLFNLQEEVLRFVATPNKELKRAYHDYHGSHAYFCRPQTETPRFGLPQGGAHSAVILSAVWKAILRLMPKENAIGIVVYADNIAIGARSAEAARAAISELRVAIQKFEKSFGLQPGALCLHEIEVCDACVDRTDEHKPISIDGVKHVNSIDFVGYKISRDLFNLKMRYRPAPSSWRKFYARVFCDWNTLDPYDFEGLRDKAVELWLVWQTGFPLWPVHRDKVWAKGRELDFRMRLLRRVEQFEHSKGIPI